MMLRQCFVLFMFAILAFSTSAVAETNLALGKSYSFSAPPNYPLCTDRGDSVQLTDGKAYGSKWTKKSTVGWMKVAPTVDIVVDLGRRYAISEIRIHTVGGGLSKVNFPEYVAVLFSTDAKVFRLCGVVSDKELANLRSHRWPPRSGMMRIGDIGVAARYIKLVLRPNVRYLFLDEIEIMGESVGIGKKSQSFNSLYEPKAKEDLLRKLEVELNLRKYISETVTGIKSKLLQFSPSYAENLLRDLERLLIGIEGGGNDIFRGVDLERLRNDVDRIRARAYKQSYNKPYVCLRANPMEVLYEKDMAFENALDKLDITLWQGEHESSAFSILNCSDEVLDLAVSISDLSRSGDQAVSGSEVVTIRRAMYVNASSRGSIGDALILQGEKPFKIEPGQQIQIWLTVYNPSLKAGDYKGSIRVLAVDPSGKVMRAETIELRVRVGDHKFPDVPVLNVCNWAYYRVSNEVETAADLRSHYTNVCVLGSGDIPFPRHTSDAPGVFRKPDFRKIDKVLSRHSYARQYLLFLNFRAKQKDWGRFGEWMTPEWKSRFAYWLRSVVDYLKDAGLGYERWALYPFDETLCDEYYELAKFTKSVDPNIRLYANSFGTGRGQIRRFSELIDIWCPQDSHCTTHPDRLKLVKSFGKEVWTYDALGPGKANDPYSYYRLQPWRAFRRGQTGVGFWVYHDGVKWKNVATPWDDTMVPMGYYGIIYGVDTSPIGIGKLRENIIPSRRWESWREGVEDYQYLYELRREIDRVKQISPSVADKANRDLENIVSEVLSRQEDSNLVYEARKSISNKLISLQKRQD